MDQARDAIATAQARLASQQASVQTARARRDQATYNVELTVIRAPQNGRIVRRYANLADSVRTALRAYADDVRHGRFPADGETYK